MSPTPRLGGLARFGLALAALVLGTGASFVLARWWSPVCHEDCLPAIQVSMWLFLLALPLALAAVVAVWAGRPRAVARIGLALAALAAVGIVLTAVAAWFQARGHGA
ncbi:MAG: hypothetical protein ACJ8GJ_02680 [Vitreoscilla sp.]